MWSIASASPSPYRAAGHGGALLLVGDCDVVPVDLTYIVGEAVLSRTEAMALQRVTFS